jgi:GTPase Era involved in 16S rRNA processing
MRQYFEELGALAEVMGSGRLKSRAADLSAWVTRPTTHVIICGEFNRGKSTLVNALLGISICPVDLLPETAVPAVFEYNATPVASVEYVDGRREHLEPSAAAFRRFSASRGDEVKSVRLLRVGMPSDLLLPGIVLVDTPGVNDLSQIRADVTHGFLLLADAAVLVLDASSPVTKTEAAFLSEQVLPNVLDRLVFVLGKADRVEPEELGEVVAGAQVRLERITGRPSSVLPLSALRAVQGDLVQLAQLRERLYELANANGNARQQLAEQRARRLADELREDLENRSRSLAVSDDEQSRILQQISEARLKTAQDADRFNDYIDLFGRRALFSLVSESTSLLEKRVLDELLHHLSLLDGRIEEFVHKQVPHLMAQAVRGWSESKSREIDTFLSNFIERISADFARAFAVPLTVASLPPRMQIPEYMHQREMVESNRIREMIKDELLPTAVPMVAGLLMGGPIGLLVGGLVGRVAQAKLHENKVSEQKIHAHALLNEMVSAVFSDLRTKLESNIASWFDRLRDAVTSEARMRIQDLELRASQSTQEQVQKLSQARESLKRIEQTIQRRT